MIFLDAQNLKGCRDLELLEDAGSNAASGGPRESHLTIRTKLPHLSKLETESPKFDNYENVNLVADDDWAVDGGADEGLDEDVKVGLSRGGRVADGDPHVVQAGEVLHRWRWS